MLWLSKAASRYEVRDYFGTLVDAAAIEGTSFSPQVFHPGWYKVYVYTDNDQGDPWGKIVGGTTFVIFRRSSGFPEMPASFEDGKYLVWDVKGHVLIRVTNVQGGGSNAVINGLFFGMPNVAPANLPNTNAVRYIATDSETQGNWKGVYGSDGFNVIGDAERYPAYSRVTSSGFLHTWEASTVNSRALQKAFTADRVAACWHTEPFNAASFTVDVNLTDGLTHRLAVYAQDWGSYGPRAEKIEILDATTGVVLDTRTLGTPNAGVSASEDEVIRGVTGMGPQRHYVADTANPDADIARLKALIAVDKQMYLPFDPVRKRSLLIAFTNGTDNVAGVRKVVEAFKDDVEYYEPRNEPNFGSSGADFVTKELIPFYQTVKSVSSSLKVIGPGIVTIGPGYGLPWIEDFLRAGGANYIDGFSFHAYNNVNGDFALAFASLEGLNALLARYGASHLEKWQTEQGYSAALYGAYQPRLQGRWTMVQMMAYEQYGVPKERNHLWYDRSHGFWDVPTWWENDDGSLNPAAPLMRVWSEELYGTTFARAFDFGTPGNQLYVGSLFTGPGKTVAAFMSAGSTDGSVELAVIGGSSIRCVSAFGNESQLPVIGGRVTLPVPELPVYVELQPGQTINVIPAKWGPNLAVQPGVTATASGSGVHPIDPRLSNSIGKIHNGALENWYYGQGNDDHPWMDDVGVPAFVELRLPSAQTIDRVVIYSVPPWQWEGTLLDYELQYEAGGKWVTLEHVVEPVNTFKVYTPNVRSTVDSFFSDRWVFQHSFPPVRTQKIRVLAHNVTWGGGANQDVANAGGQTGAQCVTLREIEVYNSTGTEAPGNGNPPGSNQPPSVSITNPAGDTQVDAPANLAIEASATDNDGTVAKVEFFAGTTKLGESGTAPYAFQWNDVAAGTHTVTAKAYDNAGASTTSSAVTVTVRPANVAASATFLRSDLTTHGDWKSTYGKDGFQLATDPANFPAYATVKTDGIPVWSWSSSSNDSRALERNSAAGRLAACWYSPGFEASSSFVIDVDLTDGNTHQLAAYVLDWDNFGPRSEIIQLVDAKTGSVLDQRSVSSFQGGQYLVWEVKGHVLLKVINTRADGNAVLSGLFFGTGEQQPPPNPSGNASATFVKVDTNTQGNWPQSYGRDGFHLIGATAKYPSYATVKGAGESMWQWAPSTDDVRGLQKVNRTAACWYTPTTQPSSSFSIDVKLTDGQVHRVALYALDWDRGIPRSQTVEVLDSATGAVLSSQVVSAFAEGKYLVWDLKGHVTFRVTNNQNGTNGVVSGLFFGAAEPPAQDLAGPVAARFVKTDETTGGNWKGVYGVDGGNVLGDTARYPSYAVVTPVGASSWTWVASTDQLRALDTFKVPDRIAACWYSAAAFTIDLDLTDGSAHQIAIYVLDWDRAGPRSETVEIVDAATGALLDRRPVTTFGAGQYLVWNLKGRLQIRVTNTQPESNAVISGLFFDAVR